ncbi:apoptosis antagonizing transcription factor-domain-containing protein, partial [Sparassis latifolia]
SLAQQLAELAEPTPLDLDPEDVHAGILPEDLSAIDDSAAREHYVDVAPSALRRLQESVSDPKYLGIRTTRKQLYEDLDQEPESEHEEELPDESVSGKDDDQNEIPSEEEEPELNDGQDGSSSHEGPPNGPDAAQSDTSYAQPVHESQEIGDLASALRKTREGDLKKGKAVVRQLVLWDALLDARIQLQKAVSATNRLPTAAHLSDFVRHPSAREALDSMLEEAAVLSEDLFKLQEGLLESNESIHAPPRKRQKTGHDHTTPEEYSDRFADLSEAASALEAAYHSHVVTTLGKWSAKVQAVAPNVLLGNRNAFNKDDKGKASVVSVIDDTLRNDGGKLLSRTRTPRGKNQRLGAAPTEMDDADGPQDDEDAEIFDDTDFYQQLLRDVIRARGGNDNGVEQDWMAQQREGKARRKMRIDTKASKGRKLRYEVHAKLQNYMVPVPVAHGDWHEEQIDALFSSLLGAA